MAIGRLLTLREAAERTGFRESTWRAWILRRKVPYHKVGRSVRVAEADLERLIEQARIPARPSDVASASTNSKSTVRGDGRTDVRDSKEHAREIQDREP